MELYSDSFETCVVASKTNTETRKKDWIDFKTTIKKAEKWRLFVPLKKSLLQPPVNKQINTETHRLSKISIDLFKMMGLKLGGSGVIYYPGGKKAVNHDDK